MEMDESHNIEELREGKFEYEDELIFEESKKGLIAEQRSVFEFYGNHDQHYSKKSKADLFTLKNIQGFLSVLQIKCDNLHFFDLEILSSEINMFMASCHYCETEDGQDIDINDNHIVVLIKGTVYKTISTAINCTSDLLKNALGERRTSQKVRNSIRQSKSNKNNASIKSVMKNTLKKLSASKVQSPITLHYEYLDRKPYKCMGSVSYFKIPLISINKLQGFLQFSYKEQLVSFISTSIGIETNKRIGKILGAIEKKIHQKKVRVNFNDNKIHMVYKGEILINYGKDKKMYLKKFGIIYPEAGESHGKKWGQTMDNETILVSIEIKSLIQCFKDYDHEVLNTIQHKISEVKDNRDKIVKSPINENKEQPKGPLIQSQSFGIKMLHKTLSIGKNNPIKPKVRQDHSSYFHVFPQNRSDDKIVRLEPECSKYMGNFPFEKIVESYDKIKKKKHFYEENQNKITKENRQRVEEQFRKIKGEKECKHIYYMNKVRRLKIKNIAEKTIPNGSRRGFDVERAQQQITNFSLFSNIIEFPVNILSQKEKNEINENTIDKIENERKSFTKLQSKTMRRSKSSKSKLNKNKERNTVNYLKEKPNVAFSSNKEREKSLISLQICPKQKSVTRMTTQGTQNYSKTGLDHSKKSVRFSSENENPQMKKMKKSTTIKPKRVEFQKQNQGQNMKNKKMEVIEKYGNKNPSSQVVEENIHKGVRRPLTSFAYRVKQTEQD